MILHEHLCCRLTLERRAANPDQMIQKLPRPKCLPRISVTWRAEKLPADIWAFHDCAVIASPLLSGTW